MTLLLFFSICATHAQVPEFIHYESFKNEKFEQLGVIEQKVWFVDDRIRRLETVKTYNDDGFILSSDSIVYQENGQIQSTVSEVFEYDKLTVLQRSLTIDSNGIDTAMTQQWVYREDGLLSERIIWKKYNGYFYKENYLYNSANRCVQIDYSNKDMPNTFYRLTFNYDFEGNLMNEFKDDLLLYEFVRDDLNRTITTSHSDCHEIVRYDLNHRINEKVTGCSEPRDKVSFSCLETTTSYRYKNDLLTKISWHCHDVHSMGTFREVETNYHYNRKGLLKKWIVRVNQSRANRYQVEYQLR